MTAHSHPIRRPSTRALLPAVVVLLALSACSSEKQRAYDLPDKLCGASVNPGTLDPLLPDGGELTQGEDPGSREDRCWVDVDGTSVMSTGALWEYAGTTPRRVAGWELGVSPADTPEGATIIHGRTGAVQRVECPAAEKGDVMYVSMRLVDREVDEKDTLAFIRSYTRGIQHTERCAGDER